MGLWKNASYSSFCPRLLLCNLNLISHNNRISHRPSLYINIYMYFNIIKFQYLISFLCHYVFFFFFCWCRIVHTAHGQPNIRRSQSMPGQAIHVYMHFEHCRREQHSEVGNAPFVQVEFKPEEWFYQIANTSLLCSFCLLFIAFHSIFIVCLPLATVSYNVSLIISKSDTMYLTEERCTAAGSRKKGSAHFPFLPDILFLFVWAIDMHCIFSYTYCGCTRHQSKISSYLSEHCFTPDIW